MLAVRVKHVDSTAGHHLPAANTKAGRDQRVFVETERCRNMLEARKNLGPDAYVFGTRRGLRRVVRQAVEAAVQEAGLPVGRKGGYVWHEPAPRILLVRSDHGANIHELRELARHADIRTTQRYLKASDERLRNSRRPVRSAGVGHEHKLSIIGAGI